MPPKRASTTKTAAKEEATKEQQKRMEERMKALAKGRKAAPKREEANAMDISDSDDEEPRPRASTARASARPRSATSTTSTSSSVSRRRSSSSSSSSSSNGGGSGSKSSTKAITAGKRKSTSPGERLTKKQAIEEAAKALKARSSNYSPSATTNTSGSKPIRTMSTSRPSATTRGRGIPSKRQAPPRRVETSDEEEDSEEEEEVIVPPPRQPTRRSLAPVSAPAPRRAAAVPPAPVPSTRANGGRSRRSYDKEEEKEVEKTQSMGVLGRLGHGVFKLLTYAIIIVSMAFALHVGVETYQHYTPLCFSDSYSNIMTGHPAGAGACKTTWPCPPLLLCHAGRVSGVVGLDEALAKVFGNSGSSSPVPPPVVSDEERSVEMEEPVQSEEVAVEEAGGEEGEDEWSEDGEDDWHAEEEEEGEGAEMWEAEQGMADADEHAAEHEGHEHTNENEREMEYGTEQAHEEEHTPQQ